MIWIGYTSISLLQNGDIQLLNCTVHFQEDCNPQNGTHVWCASGMSINCVSFLLTKIRGGFTEKLM
jgi:hypothetical protein